MCGNNNLCNCFSGNNWWCVVYPPLCFLSDSPVEYRSKIAEIIERFKRKK